MIDADEGEGNQVFEGDDAAERAGEHVKHVLRTHEKAKGKKRNTAHPMSNMKHRPAPAY